VKNVKIIFHFINQKMACAGLRNLHFKDQRKCYLVRVLALKMPIIFEIIQKPNGKAIAKIQSKEVSPTRPPTYASKSVRVLVGNVKNENIFFDDDC